MIALFFPGQGSQQRGMGSDVFYKYDDIIKQSDVILGYSIRDFCMNSSEAKLRDTKYCQPAIYVVNTLYYYELLCDTKHLPDYLCGHSLGEYNALMAGGVFDFSTGLKLVKKRGELMSRHSDCSMAAVLGLSSDEIKAIISENNLKDIYIANYNTDAQVVISGRTSTLKEVEQIFYDNYAQNYVMLNVSGAFHSPYMNEASIQFSEFLSKFTFDPPKIPVISNLTAQPYNHKNIIYNLANQIRRPVKWSDSIKYLKERNVNEFTEVGGSTLLENMVKYC